MIKRLLAFTLILPVSNASAIVNLQDIHTKELEPGFHGAVSIETSGSAGNSDINSSSLGTQLHWKQPNYSNILLFDYSYGESNKQINRDKAFLHLRHIHNINRDYAWELFNQYQRDRFARLSYRGLLGGGLRYRQIGTEYRLIYGVGGFFKQEQLSHDSVDPQEPRNNSAWHGNLYIIAARQLNQQSNIFGTLYYQPKLDEATDYRILLQTGIKVKVADNLNIQIGINGAYDSKPPTTVKDYDISYRSGLEYQF